MKRGSRWIYARSPDSVYILIHSSPAANSITRKGSQHTSSDISLLFGGGVQCVINLTWSTCCPVMLIVESILMKCPLLTPSRCWQMVFTFTSQHKVIGSAPARLRSCFSQCCYLCHKPCRVPFLTSLCCLPQSCTLPATSITHTGSYWYTHDWGHIGFC